MAPVGCLLRCAGFVSLFAEKQSHLPVGHDKSLFPTAFAHAGSVPFREAFPGLSEYLAVRSHLDERALGFMRHLLCLLGGEITSGDQAIVKHLYHLDPILLLEMEQHILAE